MNETKSSDYNQLPRLTELNTRDVKNATFILRQIRSSNSYHIFTDAVQRALGIAIVVMEDYYGER